MQGMASYHKVDDIFLSYWSFNCPQINTKLYCLMILISDKNLSMFLKWDLPFTYGFISSKFCNAI